MKFATLLTPSSVYMSRTPFLESLFCTITSFYKSCKNFLLILHEQKVHFAQVLAFTKVAKTEGEVFVALCASESDLVPFRATISPQSPCSLIPEWRVETGDTCRAVSQQFSALNTLVIPF